MKFKKFTAGFLTFAILFSIGISMVYATTTPPGQGGGGTPGGQGGGGTPAGTQSLRFTLDNPLKASYGSDIPSFLHGLLTRVILPLAEVIIVFMFIYTGFMFVMAQGNPGKLDKAKNSLLYTAIGTAILLGAWGISLIIKNTVNQVIVL